MSADGTPLSQFNDFVLATKPHKITPTTEVLGDTARNYYLIGDMISGREDHEIVQNGESIIDMVRLKKRSRKGWRKPNQDDAPAGLDVLTKLRAPWRFHSKDFAYTKEQITLNGGNAGDNWVRMLTSWRQATYQEIWDEWEESIFADPDTDEMESDDGEMPYSILAFITRDGLAPSGWTTIEGVNPATTPYWRNQSERYTGASYSTTIFRAFDRMWHKLNWDGPQNKEDWFTKTNWKKKKIVTDLAGVIKWTDQTRNSNDRLVPKDDPGTYTTNPTYGNMPMKRLNVLDDKAWTHPDYIWIDTGFIFPVWHGDVFLDEGDPIAGGIRNHNSCAVFVDSYVNNFCRSRARQGRISETAAT